MTQIGGLSNYRRALERIQTLSANAELALVIAGNHDVSLDPKWWADNLIEDEDDLEEPVKALALFDQAKSNGVHLLHEGTHNITLRDGRSFTMFASPFTPEFGGYAFAYSDEDDHFNSGPSTIPDGFDIVMTHGPPGPPANSDFLLDLGHKDEHCGCPKLYKAIRRTRPALHCFGHIHEGYGAQTLDSTEESFGQLQKDGVLSARGRTTLLVNAAIQTRDGPPNKPWVVDLELS